MKKVHPSLNREDARNWLYKQLHNAPHPLPPVFFPRLLQQAERQGLSRDFLLDVLDEWLNAGYCRLTDAIAPDIELTISGADFFRVNF